MSCYRYYLPKIAAKDVTDDMLVSLGLADRLRDCTLARHRGNRIEVTDFQNHGPDGSSGAMVTPQPADRKGVATLKAGTYEAHQSQHGGYWIVWEKANPPTPEGLQRWETVDGYEHELGDGSVWMCPTIRRAMFLPGIPCSYSRLNGELTRAPLPQYAPIFQRTLSYAATLMAGESVPLSEQWDIAIACIGVNYRVSDEEASLLALLNDRTLKSVIDAAFDTPWIESALDGSDPQKKRLLDSILSGMDSSVHGEQESSESTTQPSETSS